MKTPPPTPSGPPRLTFFVLAYNQERYIREAVAGAFAQNYSPLEILLSDDCSSDRTFEIMQEMAAAYRGPHRVALNRNPTRLGLAGHVSRGAALAHGELLVMAAGDDVSLPERCQRLADEWLRAGRRYGISSAVIKIDDMGRPTGRIPAHGFPAAWDLEDGNRVEIVAWLRMGRLHTLLGCSAAWSIEMMTLFGPLYNGIVNEDLALTFRALLGKGVSVIDEALVQYRHHAGNLWSRAVVCPSSAKTELKRLRRVGRRAGWVLALAAGFAHDATTAYAHGLLDAAEYKRASHNIARLRRLYAIRRVWWRTSFAKKCAFWAASPGYSSWTRLASLFPLRCYLAAQRIGTSTRARWRAVVGLGSERPR